MYLSVITGTCNAKIHFLQICMYVGQNRYQVPLPFFPTGFVSSCNSTVYRQMDNLSKEIATCVVCILFPPSGLHCNSTMVQAVSIKEVHQGADKSYAKCCSEVQRHTTLFYSRICTLYGTIVVRKQNGT